MIRSFARQRKFYLGILFVTGLVLLAIWLRSAGPDTVFRMIRYNTSEIDDYKIFPNRQLQASQTPFHFIENSDPSRVPTTVPAGNGSSLPLDELLSTNDTVAFLIIKNDTLVLERYFDGYTQATPSLSFSMAKSFLSILIGCAIDDGYIRSVDQPVTDFVPELAKNGYEQVAIRHLLQMTSGMGYTENDNPFGVHPRFYYTSNLEKELLKLGRREPPGREFAYKSGESALLGLILTRALGTKTITDYMQERLWEPLGMEYDGMWNIDREEHGLEKTWCCLSATARDFARLGRLYLNDGNWNGKQIVSRSWVEQSTKVDTTEGSPWNYQYQWWLASQEDGDYMAIGHLEQYLYIHPGRQLIIVRLGRSGGTLEREQWLAILKFLAEEVK